LGPRTRSLIVIVTAILAVSLLGVLFMKPDSDLILLMVVQGNIVIPAVIGFGWMYILDEYPDRLRLLSLWSASVLVICLAVNLYTVETSSWGLIAPGMVLATGTLVVIYLRGLYRRGIGGSGAIILMIAYTGLTFWLILNNPVELNPVLLDPLSPSGKNVLGALLTDVSMMGTLASLTSQIFLLDYNGKLLEQEAMEYMMNALEENDCRET